MSLGALYLSVILSNWENNQDITKVPLGNDFVFWVKTITAFATVLIYIWTMVAPSILTQRSFEFEWWMVMLFMKSRWSCEGLDDKKIVE